MTFWDTSHFKSILWKADSIQRERIPTSSSRTCVSVLFNPTVSFPTLTRVLCAAPVGTHVSMVLSQGYRGCRVRQGVPFLDEWGCCHQKQNASVCHPTVSTQATILRLYGMSILWRESPVSCTVGFLRGKKKSAWSRSFGGFRVPSRNAALSQKRQVQLIPVKLGAYEGLSRSRRVEGFLARSQAKAGWRLTALSYLHCFLWCVTVAEVCGGWSGPLVVSQTQTAGRKAELQRGKCWAWIYGNLQHFIWFLLAADKCTDDILEKANPRKHGWPVWLTMPRQWSLLVTRDKHGLCLGRL